MVEYRSNVLYRDQFFRRAVFGLCSRLRIRIVEKQTQAYSILRTFIRYRFYAPVVPVVPDRNFGR